MSILTDGSLADRLVSRLIAAGLPYALTVVRQESDGDPFNPVIVDVPHAASGWLDTYSAQDIDGTLIKSSDIKAFVLTSSVDITPTTTDKLIAQSTTYTIVSVRRDPASTCWVIQARA